MDRFQVPSQVHARRFEDELVILDLGAGTYFSLDAVGSMIWDELTGGKTANETVLALIAAYDVDESTARADVRRLSEELVQAGLLTRQP
jgi:hypothetical protein